MRRKYSCEACETTRVCIACKRRRWRDNQQQISEYRKAYNQQYHAQNREIILRRKRTQYEPAAKRQKYELRRQHALVYGSNYRAEKRGAIGRVTLEEWVSILERQRYRCFDCGDDCRLTVGHLTPLSRGGHNSADNIIAQCLPCNCRQHARVHPSVSGGGSSKTPRA